MQAPQLTGASREPTIRASNATPRVSDDIPHSNLMLLVVAIDAAHTFFETSIESRGHCIPRVMALVILGSGWARQCSVASTTCLNLQAKGRRFGRLKLYTGNMNANSLFPHQGSHGNSIKISAPLSRTIQNIAKRDFDASSDRRTGSCHHLPLPYFTPP